MQKQELPDFDSDVFISYAHEDGMLLAKFVETSLSAAGLVTYRDAHDLQYGPELLKRLVLALERSKTVVALITPAYLASEWCKGELFIGAAYNNFICVLAKGSSHTQLPFRLDTSLAVYQSALETDPNCLQKFCDSVFSIGEKRKIRTGFDGRELPSPPGAPVHVLNTMSSRTYALFVNDAGKRKLWDAAETLEACEFDGVHNAYAEFSNPKTMIAGLVSLQNALSRVERCETEWRALWRLARPFNKQVETYAFYMANISARELREETAPATHNVITREERRRRAKPISKKLQAQVDKIEPVCNHVKRADGPIIELTERRIKAAPTRVADWKHRWVKLAARIMSLRFKRQIRSLPDSNIEQVQVADSKEALSTAAAGLVAFLIAIVFAGTLVSTWLKSHTVRGPSKQMAEVVKTAPLAKNPHGLSLPAYCGSDRICQFPSGSSLWQVAEDCYGDGSRWREIWTPNEARLDRDPNKVVSGQPFVLPPAGCEALIR